MNSPKPLTNMSHTLSAQQLQTLCRAAIQAAKEAGQWIENVDRRSLQRQFKDAGNSAASQIVTEADIASEAIIRRRLQKVSAPLNIAFVGEESSASTAIEQQAQDRFEKPYFWCVDPLDGTLPFSEGRAGYAVSVALVEQSGKPIIGVVYDPAKQVLLHALKGQGSFRNLVPFSSSKQTSETLTIYADKSLKSHPNYRPTTVSLERCAQLLGLSGITLVYGSGAVKNACYVLDSNPSCYLKRPKREEGGGSIWDFAATACIVQEAGGWASNIHGQALDLNRQDSTFMNHEGVLFSSDQRIAQCVIETLNIASTR